MAKLLDPAMCRVAAERAKNYPHGFGGSYLGRRPSYDELEDVFPPIIARFYNARDVVLNTPLDVLRWLDAHPDDLQRG